VELGQLRDHAGSLDDEVVDMRVRHAHDRLRGVVVIMTFHSLRRTYASLRCACGDDVGYTADQLGHGDPCFTLRVYPQATKRRERLSKPHRDAFDSAIEWALHTSSEHLLLTQPVSVRG